MGAGEPDRRVHFPAGGGDAGDRIRHIPRQLPVTGHPHDRDRRRTADEPGASAQNDEQDRRVDFEGGLTIAKFPGVRPSDARGSGQMIDQAGLRMANPTASAADGAWI